MLIDSHCHLHEADFPIDQAEALQLAREVGVKQIIVIGTDKQSSLAAVEFSRQHEGVFATVGVHPHEASGGCDFLKQIDFKTEPKIVAIGEIGLDYHYDFSPREVQRAVFREQLALAIKQNLPVVFHVREAFSDFWQIFDEMTTNRQKIRGVVHSFSDNLANLEQALERGLYIGVNGIATFTKDTAQLEAFAKIPLNRLLIETDAPYLAPKGKRGQTNQPAFVYDIAKWLAEFYGISFDQLAATTTANAKELFGTKKKWIVH